MIVLESTHQILKDARHVTIDDSAIRAWAKDCTVSEFSSSDRVLLAELRGDRDAVANLVLLISALNFCFWSSKPIEIQWRGKRYRGFTAMLVSIILAAKHDPRWADPSYWVSMPEDELRQVLSGGGDLLMLDERIEVVRDTGRVLIDRFDGRFAAAVESVNERAWPLAVLLMTNFDGFRDVSRVGNTPVYFLKRAQICALDLDCAFRAKDWPGLAGMGELTAFADYRLPQALRHLGFMILSESLTAKIEARVEIPRDSVEEVELRAASIQAVDRMTAALRQAGRRVEPWQVDCWLWEISHGGDVKFEHHRTRTIAY